MNNLHTTVRKFSKKTWKITLSTIALLTLLSLLIEHYDNLQSWIQKIKSSSPQVESGT